MFSPRRLAPLMLLVLAATPLAAQELTLYSGRGESLVDPLIRSFERASGIKVNVRYGGTAELAVLLQEEGDASPADLYWAQDAGALGAVAERLAPLPAEVLEQVPAVYRDVDGRWVATSGRGRVLAYSKDRVQAGELPASMLDLTDERYRGRVGWAPTNGSFQAHVTAMRLVLGENATRDWLQGMIANGVKAYRNNTSQIQAIADGEIDFALPNNYYLLRQLAADAEFPVAQTLFADGDIGNLLLVAGIGVISSSGSAADGARFVEFLLSPQAQQYFTGQVYEYPVTDEVIENVHLEGYERVQASAPDVNLNEIHDLEGTLNLLREVGLL